MEASTSNAETQPLNLALGVDRVHIVFFCLTIYGIIRSGPLSRPWKLLAYSTCIPLHVLFDWAENSVAVGLYFDFMVSGQVNATTSALGPFYTNSKWTMLDIRCTT